jgi:hypothetical protein
MRKAVGAWVPTESGNGFYDILVVSPLTLLDTCIAWLLLLTDKNGTIMFYNGKVLFIHCTHEFLH